MSETTVEFDSSEAFVFLLWQKWTLMYFMITYVTAIFLQQVTLLMVKVEIFSKYL